MPKRGYRQSREHRRKLSEKKIGTKQSKETIRKRVEARKDYIHSEETKRKISESNKIALKGNIPWNKGIKMPDISGENNPNWKGGISSKINIRCSSIWWKELRKLIYKNDDWTCQICGKKCHNDIQCHHIISESEGGNHTPENLITLCKSCHMRIEVLVGRI